MDMEKIINAAATNAEENEDIQAIRDKIEQAADYIPEQDLTSKVVEFPIDANGNPNFAIQNDIAPMKTSPDYIKEIVSDDASLLTADSTDEDDESLSGDRLQTTIDTALEMKAEEDFNAGIVSNAKNKLQLSDEDANKILDCILVFRKDKKANLYNYMPDVMKSTVNQIIIENNLSILQRNEIARMMISEFMSQAEEDNMFEDFEEALERAMKIPSLTDMYSEYLSETMGKKLPSIAAAIENEDPEKAKLIREIGKRFEWSYRYADLYDQYDNNTRIRKAVRRDYQKWDKSAAIVNFINDESKFKMPDARVVGVVLGKTLLEEPGTDITPTDVDKFLTLLFETMRLYKGEEIQNSSYRYYALKNISMLSYTNNEAVGSFSLELISNIKSLMYYIRAKEAEFNALNGNTNMRKKRDRKRK